MDWFLYDNGLRHERVELDKLTLSFGELAVIKYFIRVNRQEALLRSRMITRFSFNIRLLRYHNQFYEIRITQSAVFYRQEIHRKVA